MSSLKKSILIALCGGFLMASAPASAGPLGVGIPQTDPTPTVQQARLR